MNTGGGSKGGNDMAKIDYRGNAIRAAKELRYSQSVINSIKAATNDIEIERIMCTARNQDDIRKPRQKVSCKLNMNTIWC